MTLLTEQRPQGAPTSPIVEVGNLQIIPARASFAHTRRLIEESAADWNHADQIADVEILHLDDPHTDALLALRDGRPVAYVAVLSVGDVGAGNDLFVAKDFRGQGIGRTMVSRALEICARSQFRHVFLHVRPELKQAIQLYEACGFRKIGDAVAYLKQP